MLNLAGMISITLGSVVLDRPDQTGRFFAKDLVGGWAYSIADAQGDARGRGQGVCDGGLDLTLRCALLSALNRASDGTAIRVLVETREAHRMLVRLASQDMKVVSAIGGRVVSVMTRPDARSTFQVRTAADRAAAAALRDREHAERQHPALVPVSPEGVSVAAVAVKNDWRARIGQRSAHLVVAMQNETRAATKEHITPRPAATGAVVPADRTVKAWLEDLSSHIETVRGDLQNYGM